MTVVDDGYLFDDRRFGSLSQDDGALLIPPDLVARWAKQIDTPYADLPHSEQESDKEQVERYLPIIEEAFDKDKPAW